MEIFERAHVAKHTDSSGKENKSDENMKKQLKRMLYGYKTSDNDAIRNAVELGNDPDDSTSVSGYSDLNITNSTIDADASFNTMSSEDAELHSEENLDDLSTSPKNKDNKVNKNDTVSVSITSLSDSDDDLESLSDLPCEVHETSSSDEKSPEIFSLDSSYVEITSENESDQSEGTESFDTDGALAAVIHSKLEKTVKQIKPNKKKHSIKNNVDGESSKEVKYKGPYRPQTDDSSLDISREESKSKIRKKKLVNPKHSTSSSTLEDEDMLITDLSTEECPVKKSSKHKNKQSEESTIENKYKGPFNPNKNNEYNDDSSSSSEYKGPCRPKEMLTPEMQTVVDESSNSLSCSDTSRNSSPFVSIDASEVACKSLEDVIGEYSNPTIRNLPSDTNCNFDSALFETDSMNVDDVLIEEDADSLVPEVPDDIVIEDLEDVPMETMEIDTEELDLSPQLVVDDSNTEYNNTMFSDTSYNAENSKLNNNIQSQDVLDRDSPESFEETVVNPVKVYYAKNKCIFILKHPSEMFIHGKVKVKTLGGKIEVLGHISTDDTYEIYAPSYNCAQFMKTIENDSTYNGLFGKLTGNGLSVSEAEEIVVCLGEHDGVVCMQPLKSPTMDFVEESFTMTDLFSKPTRSIENCLKKASEVLGCSLYLTRPWKCYGVDPSWEQAIACGMNNQSKAVVCGGKGSGKSTFLRYYVNRLLSRGPVLVVDLDPGQCEFTPAGNVAATVVTQPLLGPSYTHLKTPQIMFNLGIINTMDNVQRYAHAVQKLVTHCHNDETLQNMPWIINTMGMTNAIGLRFITFTILLAKPSLLLQLDSKNPKRRYSCQLNARTVNNLYHTQFRNDFLFKDINGENLEYTFLTSSYLEKGGKNNFSLAPRDERYLNFLAYFGQVLTSRERGLLDVIPYEVNLNALYVGVNVRIPEDAARHVLNGKVVALCTVADPPRRPLFLLGTTPLLCHGHGLIRGIDWTKGVLYVITPVGDKLSAVNALVYADWVPEIRGPEAYLPAGLPVPYRTASHYQQRHFMFAPKRRFNPLQLIKMSRTT